MSEDREVPVGTQLPESLYKRLKMNSIDRSKTVKSLSAEAIKIYLTDELSIKESILAAGDPDLRYFIKARNKLLTAKEELSHVKGRNVSAILMKITNLISEVEELMGTSPKE